MDHDIEVTEVLLVWYGTNSWHPIQLSTKVPLLQSGSTNGSATRRSVSLMILFGNAAILYESLQAVDDICRLLAPQFKSVFSKVGACATLFGRS